MVVLSADQDRDRIVVGNFEHLAGERCCKRWQRREYRDEE
jgi:hypothetical protein